MSYIGRDTDKISNVEKLDTLTFDGSESYPLQKNSVDFVPTSANAILLSIDGVMQYGNFTISGSTIDFDTAIASTSTCDFVLHIGAGIITAPSDGSVTTAKIQDSAITTDKINANAVTSAKMFSTFKNGITMADQWRLTADLSSNANPISSNLERVDNATFAKIGTGMSVSSGYWSFPSTGLYMIILSVYGQPNNDAFAVYIQATSDDSTYDNLTPVFVGGQTARGRTNCGSAFVNVTNTSTHKVKFELSGLGSGSLIGGNTNQNLTHFTFLRIGDSQ